MVTRWVRGRLGQGDCSDASRSRGQVIDLFTKKSKTCPSDLSVIDDFACLDLQH